MSESVLAWHFAKDTLRDGSPIPEDGEWLVHEGEIKVCASGLHASERLADALFYAPGHTLCRVECRGDIEYQDDKLVCRERKILWRIDAEELLQEAARRFALDVIHLWDAPKVVRDYLETGDEALRGQALAEAAAAARTAACAAGWAAAEAAKGVTETAGAEARAAADAAKGVTETAAARASARAAVRAEAWAKEGADAWAEAWAAAEAAQDKILLELVEKYKTLQQGGESDG